MKVSTVDFIKNYGVLADKALLEPVIITKNGRDRLVVLSADEFARLKQYDRRAVRLEDFTPEDIAEIAATTMPEGYDHLDAELKGVAI